jgi:hypothetical protein
MDGILGRLRWTAALCYIDDVIIFSNTVEEHVGHIRYILEAATKAGLKFSPAKCHFGYASLKLLGRRVSTEGLGVLQDKLAAVRELSPPKTLKELWHVLGLFGYYRSFIHRYSLIAISTSACSSCFTIPQTTLEQIKQKPTPAHPTYITLAHSQLRPATTR